MKHFQIPNQTICKEDLLEMTCFKEKYDRINALSDEDMQRIADNVGRNLIDDYWWATLKEATEKIFDEVRE